jgi:chaperone modulatory protein CbpM
MAIDETLTGTVLDELEQLTLTELAEICLCKTEWIVDLVEEGIIEPVGQDIADWQFTGVSVIRVRTATRLHEDLDINLAGIALAIDLLEEVSDLQARLKVVDPE